MKNWERELELERNGNSLAGELAREHEWEDRKLELEGNLFLVLEPARQHEELDLEGNTNVN